MAKLYSSLEPIHFLICTLFQPLFFTCDYPVAASLMFAFTGVQYFFLFLAFYKKAYSGNKVAEKKMVEKNNNVIDSKIE